MRKKIKIKREEIVKEKRSRERERERERKSERFEKQNERILRVKRETKREMKY